MSILTNSTNIVSSSIDTTGSLSLGSSATDITLGSNTGTPTIFLDTASTNNTNANPAIAIGSSSANKTIKINNNTGSVHCSAIDLKGSSINHITPANNPVFIGDAQTGTLGVLNLGNNPVRTGAINVGSSTNAGTLTLNTTNVVSIGANSSLGITLSNNAIGTVGTTINGIILRLTAGGYQIDGSTTGNVCNFFNSNNHGINTGQGQLSTSYQIGNNPSRTGSILIGQAQLASLTRISGLEIQGYKLNVCTNTTTTPLAVPLVIGDSVITSAVNIGKSGANTGIQGTASVAGLVTATLGVTSPIPYRVSYSTLPTFTSSQIGYTIQSVIATNTTVGIAGSFFNPFSATTFSLDIGVWSMQYQIRLRSATSSTVTVFASSGALATIQNGIINYGLIWNTGSTVVTTSSNFSFCGSAIITNSTAGNVLSPSVSVNYTPASSCQFSGGNCYFSVTRIA
jgi:hypothetical protein